MQRYNPNDIEAKWQKVWAESKLYEVTEESGKPKQYVTAMFPYPSGAGLHVGHVRNYSITDAIARFQRQNGNNTLSTIGWDGFGLPAENYAIKTGTPPAVSTAQNVANFKSQLQRLGMSYDWSREVNTTDPEYYKWTQYLFTQLFERGLAYQKQSLQWWCPHDKTVLANEQVEGGKCWRCGHEVIKKSMKQWFFKITDYADELLDGIEDLDWPEKIKTMQRNWIGRSNGAEINFEIEADLKGQNYVFLHGFTGTNENDFWLWLKDELEKKGAQVYAPNLPNTQEPDVETQVEYVLKNHTFDTHSHIIGHSLGAAVAMKLIPRLKESLASLTLVAPALYSEFANNRSSPVLDKASDWQFDYDAVTAKVQSITVLCDSQDHMIPQEKVLQIAADLGTEAIVSTAQKAHFTGSTERAVLHAVIPSITVFTTRPDTIFGATFLVLAPEHPLVEKIVTDERRDEVLVYRDTAIKKSEIERQENKDKTGEFTGAYAINPATNKPIPIWVADYVLYGYGTGAIMAVPGHDERDNEFAKKFALPITYVVEPVSGEKQGDEVEKEAIIVVLRNPQTGKVLMLDWGPRQARHGGNMFIGGGVDKGEDFVVAARREIEEETGYTNLRHVTTLPYFIHSYYFSNVKNKNYYAHIQGMLFDLIDETQTEQKLDEGEKNQFELKWVNPEQAIADDLAHNHVLAALVKDEIFHDEGVIVNSSVYDGLSSAEAREKIVANLEEQGVAYEKVNYKMRDWLISRQRYWGAPIPIIHCPKDGAVAVPEKDLPVILPHVEKYEPDGSGKGVLAQSTEWVHTTCPKCGGPAERETDTMDGYVDSSWYLFRYADAHNDNAPWEPAKANYWAPVDFYCGGDHAVAHLLYVRFWTHVFKKMGLTDFTEPIKRLVYNGYIYASDGTKMSKSKGNVVDPLEVIDSGYGADSLRTYELFIGPYEQDNTWDPGGVAGSYRFLNRLWNLTQEFLGRQAEPAANAPAIKDDILRSIHKATKKVTGDMHDLSFNTAIAAMMECVNQLYKLKEQDVFAAVDEWRYAIETLLQLVAPFAPHMSEELWQQMDRQGSVHTTLWPTFDEIYLQESNLTIVVQVNGKLRAELSVANDTTEADIVKLAQADPRIQAHVSDKTIRKTIYVAGKLLNFVVS